MRKHYSKAPHERSARATAGLDPSGCALPSGCTDPAWPVGVCSRIAEASVRCAPRGVPRAGLACTGPRALSGPLRTTNLDDAAPPVEVDHPYGVPVSSQFPEPKARTGPTQRTACAQYPALPCPAQPYPAPHSTAQHCTAHGAALHCLCRFGAGLIMMRTCKIEAFRSTYGLSKKPKAGRRCMQATAHRTVRWERTALRRRAVNRPPLIGGQPSIRKGISTASVGRVRLLLTKAAVRSDTLAVGLRVCEEDGRQELPVPPQHLPRSPTERRPT
jgi:hypothetical protein